MGVFFFLLNAVTSFGNWWFYWPMLGWGIGILFHYFDVFGLPGVGEISKEWEEKAILKEMERMEWEEKTQMNKYERKKEPEPEENLELKELERVRKKRLG